MNADQGVVMLGNQVQAEDPLGAIGKSKRNSNGHQEITNSLEVGSMTVDLGTVMTADREIGMTADLVMIVAEVMTAGMEDSVVVTAIEGTTVEDGMTVARTTGVQDLVDFHLHHVMTAEEE